MRSRSNAHALFHSGIILPLLLAAAAASPFATAQMSEGSSSPGFSYSDFSPSMVVVIMVLLSAFFLMAFLSVYIRYCADESSESVNLRQAAAAAARLRQPRGLDPEVIETFPIFHYSEVKDSKIDKGALECAVCIAEFENDETLRLLPKCNHVFHPECIDAWLASHTTCPVCRANLSPPSPDELGAQGTESTQPNDSAGLGEAPSQSENQYQVSIDITDEVQQRQLSDVPRLDRKREGRFSRSHSTGHSLVQLEVNSDRFTLRLPEELRRQILKRTTSCCVVVLPTTEGSSRRGEGSGRGRQVGRLDRDVRSDRWVFSMTPPFFSRARLVASPKVGFEGDVTPVGGSSKLFLTSVKTPFDCLAVKSDGVEQTSTLPHV